MDSAQRYTRITRIGQRKNEQNLRFTFFSSWGFTHFRFFKWWWSRERHKRSSTSTCCTILSQFDWSCPPHEQPDDPRGNDPDRLWHERHPHCSLPGIPRNQILKQVQYGSWIHRSRISMGFLPNIGLPLLSIGQCLCQYPATHWRVVHHRLCVQVLIIDGVCPLLDAPLLELLFNKGWSQFCD